jgi:hypothetical protein
MKEDAKWKLLDRIQENAEGWENDKGRKSGINYDYECIKTFMGTDDFHTVSTTYGLDSQILYLLIGGTVGGSTLILEVIKYCPSN